MMIQSLLVKILVIVHNLFSNSGKKPTCHVYSLIMFIHDVSQTAPENPPPTHLSPQKDTYYSTADKVASSRCSVSWGAARKTAREKIKKNHSQTALFYIFSR